jgi:hypothetical protein
MRRFSVISQLSRDKLGPVAAGTVEPVAVRHLTAVPETPPENPPENPTVPAHLRRSPAPPRDVILAEEASRKEPAMTRRSSPAPDIARRLATIRRLPLPAGSPPDCAWADQRPRAPLTAPLRVERGVSQFQGRRAPNATVPLGVKLLRWPAESAQRARYQAMGVPRLLLVEGQSPAPVCTDICEDWVRAPVSDADLRVRVAALRARSQAYQLPQIDPCGVLRFAERFVAVPPSDACLLECLIREFGIVVARSTLGACLPDRPGEAGRNALDLRIMRLGQRIRPLDLVIHRVRGGYLLDRAAGKQPVEATRRLTMHQNRARHRTPGGQLNGLIYPERTAEVTPLRRRRSGHGVA